MLKINCLVEKLSFKNVYVGYNLNLHTQKLKDTKI